MRTWQGLGSVLFTGLLVSGIALLEAGLASAVETVFTDDVRIQNASFPSLILEDTGVMTQAWRLEGSSVFLVKDVNTDADPFLITAGAPNQSLTVSSSGNIGLGSTSAQKQLHLFGRDNELDATIRLQVQAPNLRKWDLSASSTGFGLIDVTNNNRSPLFVEANTPDSAFYLQNTGSVGLGTDLPGHINGVLLNGDKRHLNLVDNLGTARGIVQGRTGAESYLIHTQGAANLRTARMRVANGRYFISAMRDNLTSFNEGFAFTVDLSNGNVGIKTQSPAHPLQVGDVGGLTDGNGARCTAGGVWTNASSRSFKQDIEPISSEQARELVRALQPVGYRYKNELDEHYVGFIAEDVPDLVATKDRKSIASMDVTAVLTKVVQDQEQAIERLTKTNAQLEKANAEQRALTEKLMQRLEALERKVSAD